MSNLEKSVEARMRLNNLESSMSNLEKSLEARIMKQNYPVACIMFLLWSIWHTILIIIFFPLYMLMVIGLYSWSALKSLCEDIWLNGFRNDGLESWVKRLAELLSFARLLSWRRAQWVVFKKPEYKRYMPYQPHMIDEVDSLE